MIQKIHSNFNSFFSISELLPAFADSFLIHRPQPEGLTRSSKGVISDSPCPTKYNMKKKEYITNASHLPSCERRLLGTKVKFNEVKKMVAPKKKKRKK